MIRNKIDLIAALKEAGITSYSNRKERIFGEQEMQNMRDGKVPSKGVLNKLCSVLHCQPGDLIEYIPDEAEYRTGSPSDRLPDLKNVSNNTEEKHI